MGVMALLAPWFLRPGTESRERAVRSLLFGGSRIADGTEARRTDRLREKHNERKSFQIKISHFSAFEWSAGPSVVLKCRSSSFFTMTRLG